MNKHCQGKKNEDIAMPNRVRIREFVHKQSDTEKGVSFLHVSRDRAENLAAVSFDATHARFKVHECDHLFHVFAAAGIGTSEKSSSRVCASDT